jgi:hypothetical protein
MAPDPSGSSLCQFRVENARCVFEDGHPGAHVCVRPHGSNVPIRGEGEIPDETYLWRPPRGAPPAGEDVRGLWSEGMIMKLLAEIHEAGASSPTDWVANLPRLRGEGVPPSG